MTSDGSNDEHQQPGDLEDFEPTPMMAGADQVPEALFGDRLRAVRLHYRLNVEALARLSKAYDVHELRGVSANAIARYETGAALPSVREVRLLCGSLGVPADWLIFGTVPEAGDHSRDVMLLRELRQFVIRTAEGHDVTSRMVRDIDGEHDKETRRQRIEQARKPETR